MTIYDIAKESGVSIATVSRVLNNRANVRPNTRDRVLQVLARHNYVRSSIAQSLVNKSTRTVGVLTMDVRHLHYANIAFMIEQKLSAYGYNVILCNTGYDKQKMGEYYRVLAEKQVDGVIMVGSVFSCEETKVAIDRYLRATPIVMHNSRLKAPNVFNISTEEAHGIELAMAHLVEKRGIREIAFIQDYDTTVGLEKHATYLRKGVEYGLTLPKNLTVQTVSGVQGGIRAIAELNRRGARYRAIIGCDDITCLGAMQQLRRSGVRIPEDVAVIGFNNTVFSEISDPPMTVIDNKEETSGIMLARAMGDILRGQDIPYQTIVYPELIYRETA